MLDDPRRNSSLNRSNFSILYPALLGDYIQRMRHGDVPRCLCPSGMVINVRTLTSRSRSWSQLRRSI